MWAALVSETAGQRNPYSERPAVRPLVRLPAGYGIIALFLRLNYPQRKRQASRPAFFLFPIDPPVALIRQLPFLPFPYPVEEKGADLKGSNLSSHHTIQQKKGGLPAA